MYRNPAFDCAGAQIHAVSRQLATVVTVDGVVDDANIEKVSALTRRFIIPEKGFVLDLSNVKSLSMHCVSLLSSIDEACFHGGVEWSLIANEPVLRVLQAAGLSFPVADSVADALHYFGECITERRCLLPLLTKKSA